MNIRWIALGCVMQGSSVNPILTHYGLASGPMDFETALAMLAVGLVIEVWPGKRWFATTSSR